jgi:hypothetical protein
LWSRDEREGSGDGGSDRGGCVSIRKCAEFTEARARCHDSGDGGPCSIPDRSIAKSLDERCAGKRDRPRVHGETEPIERVGPTNGVVERASPHRSIEKFSMNLESRGGDGHDEHDRCRNQRKKTRETFRLQTASGMILRSHAAIALGAA